MNHCCCIIVNQCSFYNEAVQFTLWYKEFLDFSNTLKGVYFLLFLAPQVCVVHICAPTDTFLCEIV